MAKQEASGFSAPIVYVQPPFEELERRFPDGVDPDFEGRRFDPIERCKAVSRESREVAFEYFCLERDASDEEVLAEMGCSGVRPALYEEFLGFTEKYPDEGREFPIAALGSEARVDGDRRNAYRSDEAGGRGLELGRATLLWNEFYRFLVARE